MKSFNKIVAMMMLALFGAFVPAAQAKDTFKVAISVYAGWMPYYLMKDKGIMQKWASKYGIKVELAEMSYGDSIDAFTAAKDVDGVVITNMDTLMSPALSGLDCVVLNIHDFSNGNDAVLSKLAKTLPALRGQTLYLVEGSVSEYLLQRALESAGMKPGDVKVVNVKEDDIVASVMSGNIKNTVTWNPYKMQVAQMPGVTNLFDSSKIPGEIVDMIVVNGAVLKANPNLGKALTGAWYDVMSMMSGRGPRAEEAIAAMAKRAGSSTTEFKKQLETTALFYTPAAALQFMKGKEIQGKMATVADFVAARKLVKATPKNIGIRFPDGTVIGNKANVKMTFDATFTELAAAGKL